MAILLSLIEYYQILCAGEEKETGTQDHVVLKTKKFIFLHSVCCGLSFSFGAGGIVYLCSSSTRNINNTCIFERQALNVGTLKPCASVLNPKRNLLHFFHTKGCSPPCLLLAIAMYASFFPYRCYIQYAQTNVEGGCAADMATQICILDSRRI